MAFQEPMSGGSPYARKYKDRTAEHTAAVDRMRERDRDRAVELGKELVRLDVTGRLAEDRAAVSQAAAEVHWEMALEALWAESWLRLLPKPRAAAVDPTGPAPACRLDDELDRLTRLDGDLERRSDALHAALNRGRWSLPRRVTR